MLLRSSSTPISQILFAESPNRDIDNITSDHHCINANKVSFHVPSNHLCSVSCNSSPSNNLNGKLSFRRVQSDGNLKGLLSSSDLDEVYRSKVLTTSSYNQENVILHSEPSFSVYNQDLEAINDVKLVRSVTIGNDIADIVYSDDFSFGKKVMGLIKEDDNEEGDQGEENKERVLDWFKDAGIEEGTKPVSPMYVAAGFGIDGNGMDNGGSDFVPTDFDDNGDVEAYYKRLLKKYPSNPLFLRNYAQLLQSKGDLYGAEEYYFQATLADPQDGDILSRYAKLVWQLHQDKGRALNYFECAARMAPEDSQVLAACASFLWEIDDDNNEHDMNTLHDKTELKETKEVNALQDMDFEEDKRPVSPPLYLAAGLGIGSTRLGGGNLDEFTTSVSNGEGNIEDHYRSMIQQNPNNPLLLGNYAQFLDQRKGDLEGAEEYYSRTVLADASDGEIISQYAKLTWQLHHDKDKASSYFKRAIQASPGDSNVLAAYARFLWETEDEEEGFDKCSGVAHFHGALAATNA